MPVKKPVARKSVAKKPVATKTAPPAKRGPGRPRKVVETPVQVPVKRGPGRPRKNNVEQPLPSVPVQEYTRYSEKDFNRQIQGIKYKDLADLMGVGVGSERFLVAVELLKGGVDRQDVNQRLAEMLPSMTRNGTKKSVSNTVSIVLKGLVEAGFEVKGTWKVAKTDSVKL